MVAFWWILFARFFTTIEWLTMSLVALVDIFIHSMLFQETIMLLHFSVTALRGTVCNDIFIRQHSWMESKFLSIILRNNSIQIYENKPINYSSWWSSFDVIQDILSASDCSRAGGSGFFGIENFSILFRNVHINSYEASNWKKTRMSRTEAIKICKISFWSWFNNDCKTK